MLVFRLHIAAVCTAFLFDVFIIIIIRNRLNNMCPTFSIISWGKLILFWMELKKNDKKWFDRMWLCLWVSRNIRISMTSKTLIEISLEINNNEHFPISGTKITTTINFYMNMKYTIECSLVIGWLLDIDYESTWYKNNEIPMEMCCHSIMQIDWNTVNRANLQGYQ